MVAISPAVFAPAMTYGAGGICYSTNASDTTGTATGGAYRVQHWQTATNTSTYPIGWDTSTAMTGPVAVEMDYIQYRTLDMPYTQIMPGAGLTVRVCYGNGNGAGAIYYGDASNIVWTSTPKKTPAERLKEILNSRMAPGVLTNCRPLGLSKDIREIRARETLFRVLGEEKYRDFVRRGSVSVRAKSGLVYQIFPGHDFTKVYGNGKMIDRLCVVLNGDFPPTDSLIMRYLMILNNEQQFRSYANKHGAQAPLVVAQQPDQRSLAEIFRELKKVA